MGYEEENAKRETLSLADVGRKSKRLGGECNAAEGCYLLDGRCLPAMER